jgi:hypothetical protein
MARHRKTVSHRHTKTIAALATTGAAALTLGFSGTALGATTSGSGTGTTAGTGDNGGSFGEFTDLGNLSGLVSGFVRSLTTTPYFPPEHGASSGGLLG